MSENKQYFFNNVNGCKATILWLVGDPSIFVVKVGFDMIFLSSLEIEMVLRSSIEFDEVFKVFVHDWKCMNIVQGVLQ